MLLGRKKPLAPACIRTSDRPCRCLVSIPNTRSRPFYYLSEILKLKHCAHVAPKDLKKTVHFFFFLFFLNFACIF